MNPFLKKLPPLDSLIFFESVVRNGSFTKAAKELFVTQSAVSKQIKALETCAQVRLFERQARGILPNAAGAAFYAQVEPLLSQLALDLAGLRAQSTGNALTVICTHAVAQYWLFPKLLAFSRVHPAITVNIHASNDIHELNVGNYDLGILYGAGHWSTLNSQLLFKEKVYPIASTRLPDTASNFEDLKALQLIQLDSSAWNCINWGEWFQHFDEPFKPCTQAITFNQVTLAFDAVLAGMGVGLGWDFMAKEKIREGTLKRISSFVVETGNADFLVHPRHRPISEATAIFKNWLLEHVADQASPL